MQYVWLYIKGPDDGSELRLSMRSVVEHIPGDKRITIIGDKPDWYKGHFLPCTRIQKIRGVRHDQVPFHDTKNKIIFAANHPEIEEDFFWMMDDQYILRSTEVDDLSKPRFDPWFRSSRRRPWHLLISNTFSALRENGYPTLQGATHLPHRFNKTSLHTMFSEFKFASRMLLFELLYFNRFRENAEPYPPFLRRLLSPESSQSLTQIATKANVLNYTSNCWNKTTKTWLFQKFTQKTEWEG